MFYILSVIICGIILYSIMFCTKEQIMERGEYVDTGRRDSRTVGRLIVCGLFSIVSIANIIITLFIIFAYCIQLSELRRWKLDIPMVDEIVNRVTEFLNIEV